MSIHTIDQAVHHLGDQDLPDWSLKEGHRWQKDFELREVPGDAVLVLDVFHTQTQANEIWINNKKIGHLFQNPVLEWIPCSVRIPKDYLLLGNNTLAIQAGKLPSGTVDDFQFRNVRIAQSPPRELV